jgi:VCBS repeat-containing protein
VLNPVGVLPCPGDLPRFDMREAVVLDEKLATGPLEDYVRQAMDRLAEGGTFGGMLFLQNPTKPLKLSGSWRGQWVLAANGSISIEGLTRGDPAKDSFTIIKVDAPNTTLALSGNVQATVVGTGQAFTISQGTQITGGLFLEDVPAAASIAPLADGPEKLTAEPAKADQDAKLTRRVTLSPWTRSTRIARTL